MLKFSIICLLAITVVAADIYDVQWDAFKQTYGKVFTFAQENVSKGIFRTNAKSIDAHNKRFAQGKETYALGINQFADMDPDEFHRTHHGKVLDPKYSRPQNIGNTSTSRIEIQAAATFDWRTKGKVTPIKYQGSCGSCWAFAAIGVIESQMLMTNRGNQDLSEEELVDCYKKSCGGDDQRNAWDWLKSNGGAQTEASYPYTATKGKSSSCKMKNGKSVVKVTGYKQLKMPTDDETLKNYLTQNGPITVDVDAGKWSQSYSKGVMSCSPTNCNHAVMLVGWGNGYWIIKNSWSTGWGKDGYGHIAMGKTKDCGITKWTAAFTTLG